MAESHIAHVIATFSELGIATSLVWLSDVVKLRTDLDAQLLIAEESMRITTEECHAKADQFSKEKKLENGMRSLIYKRLRNRKYRYMFSIALLLGLLRWSPYLCIGLGVYALFGIAFYPNAPYFLQAYFSFNKETLDLIYFGIAFLSFMVICIPVVATIARSVINRYALKDIPIK